MQKTLLWSPFITETRRKIVFPTRCLRIFAQMLMCEELFFPWVKYWGRLSRGKILKPWVGEELRKVGWGEVELEQRVVLWFGTNQSNQTNTLSPRSFFHSSEFLWFKEEFSCVFVLVTFVGSICCLCLRSWLNILCKLCWLILTVLDLKEAAFCIIDGTWLTPAPFHLEEVLNTALMLVIGPGRPLWHKLVITA